jgi:arginase
LLIGGDHSQAFASVSALLNIYPDLKILWFDAHADMNTPETSPSGNSHGMPLSGLLGLVDKNIWAMPWMNQLLKPEQVIHIGVRDMDHGEIELMDKHNIEHYTPDNVEQLGLENIMNDIAKRWKGFPTHLSFDIDGLDSSLVPATGTPVGKGLNMTHAFQIIDSIKSQFDFVAGEVVEFNPDLAKDKTELEITEKNVKEIIKRIIS